jgi:hypothetical protein
LRRGQRRRRVFSSQPNDGAAGGQRNEPEGYRAGLNERGIPTARGDGEWTATQVMRIIDRI